MIVSIYELHGTALHGVGVVLKINQLFAAGV
jgi:hypothetical protein